MDANRSTEQTRDGEVMEKTVLRKEDGRRLISYRFRPASEPPAPRPNDNDNDPNIDRNIDHEGEPRE